MDLKPTLTSPNRVLWKPKDADPSKPSKCLTIKSVDLCIIDNGLLHHTQFFSIMNESPSSQLVVRRGQPFKLKLTCNRPYRKSTDGLSFVVTVADDEKPSFGHGTLVPIALSKNAYELGDQLEWGAAIESINGDVLTVLVKPSAQAPVTQWRVDIDTKEMETGDLKTFSLHHLIFILFNPWCESDQVYLAREEKRIEYVLMDNTLIFRGTDTAISELPWELGQFKEHILECALHLVANVGRVKPARRGDPVKVCRAISFSVNSSDNPGCLVGSWESDFSEGTAPNDWTGSIDILHQYFKTKLPVKFGQCWVFGGVVTTIARALGIPSRIITNFNSAHDTQGSLTLDFIYGADGRLLEDYSIDSIWNFHVWNEVWIKRPDFGTADYDGWQAIDATPQEKSGNQFRCGPAPVAAVKSGKVSMCFDSNFLFAEVNADKLFWRYSSPTEPMKLLSKDVTGVGRKISTKAVGSWDREDITSNYKFLEGTQAERRTMVGVLKQTNNFFSRYYLNEEFNEVQFQLNLLDSVVIGEDIKLRLDIMNNSKEKMHSISGSLRLDRALYTGKKRVNVQKKEFTTELAPGAATVIELVVPCVQYREVLIPQSVFKMSCMAKVRGTDYDYFSERDFVGIKPKIEISFLGDDNTDLNIFVNVSRMVKFKLKNPFRKPLKMGHLLVQGDGFAKPIEVFFAEIVGLGVVNVIEELIPVKPGKTLIWAKFKSVELDDIHGRLEFSVQGTL